MWMFRVTELQSKLDDTTAKRRSLADSTSSPVDDELRNISDTSFSSDRPPAFRPPLPPPRPPPSFFGYRHSPRFIPPFYDRRPPLPDWLHSPPAFDAYHVRESPRPRDISPPAGRRPLLPEHHRSAPPFDSYHEESYTGTSPRPPTPPKGNSPPYYDRRHGGGRSLPSFDSSHNSEHYGRRSPRAGENSTPRRDWYHRQERPQTPDKDSFNVPSGISHKRSHPVPAEEKYQQPHPSQRNRVDARVDADSRPTNVRSPVRTSQSPVDNDSYPTY